MGREGTQHWTQARLVQRNITSKGSETRHFGSSVKQAKIFSNCFALHIKKKKKASPNAAYASSMFQRRAAVRTFTTSVSHQQEVDQIRLVEERDLAFLRKCALRWKQ